MALVALQVSTTQSHPFAHACPPQSTVARPAICPEIWGICLGLTPQISLRIILIKTMPATLPPLPLERLRHPGEGRVATGARMATLGSVLIAHLGAGWGLMQIDAVRTAVGQAAPLMVSLIHNEPPPLTPPPAPAPSELPKAAPPPPKPVIAAKPKPKPQPEPDIFTAPPPPPVTPAPPEPMPVEAAPAPSVTTPPTVAPPLANAQDMGCPNTEPAYPVASQQLGEQGVVVLQLLIDPQGKVTEAVVHQSSGYPRLDRAAMAVAKQGRCKNTGGETVHALRAYHFETEKD